MTTTTVTSAREAISWSELEAAAPAITDAGRRLFYARGDGEAILATIRGDGLPRIHPVNIGLVDGRLYTFVIGSSAKSPYNDDSPAVDGTRKYVNEISTTLTGLTNALADDFTKLGLNLCAKPA